jgi:hypothetical protein
VEVALDVVVVVVVVVVGVVVALLGPLPEYHGGVVGRSFVLAELGPVSVYFLLEFYFQSHLVVCVLLVLVRRALVILIVVVVAVMGLNGG